MRRSLCGHLQGKWPCVLTMPRGAATSPRAAELAWGWGILGGGGGCDTHTASQVLPGLGEEGQGPLACLGKPGGGGEPQHGGGEGQLGFHQHHSVRHLRAGASRLWTQSTRAGCGLEVRVLKTCPGVWMEVGPVAGGPGWRWAGTPFLQHHLALTDSSAILHFRWKSLVLHLRFDSSMMSSCRHKTRVGLKNCHLDFWRCCAIPVSLEGFETRTKFGPTSFFVLKTPLENIFLIPKLLQKTSTLSLGVSNLASALPCPPPAHSPLLPAALTNCSFIFCTAFSSWGTRNWYLDRLQLFFRVSWGKAAPRPDPSTSTSSRVRLRCSILPMRARR